MRYFSNSFAILLVCLSVNASAADLNLSTGESAQINGSTVTCGAQKEKTCEYIYDGTYCGYDCEYIYNGVYCPSEPDHNCSYIYDGVYCGQGCKYFYDGVSCSEGGLANPSRPNYWDEKGYGAYSPYKTEPYRSYGEFDSK